MTVSTEVDHNEYTGNGVTTSFPYTFRIFRKSDLVVQVSDLNGNVTELVLDTGYTVTGAGTYSGGSVVLPSPLAAGWRITIDRVLDVVQETDLRNQGKFFPEVHEDAFDYLTMLIQQCFGWFRRALMKPSLLAKYYDAKQNRISNLADPSLEQDAVNNRSMRNYVDAAIAGVVGGFGWFIQYGSGAVYRTFQDKMRDTVSPKDFGAVGDGQYGGRATNDDAAFESLEESHTGKVIDLQGRTFQTTKDFTKNKYFNGYFRYPVKLLPDDEFPESRMQTRKKGVISGFRPSTPNHVKSGLRLATIKNTTIQGAVLDYYDNILYTLQNVSGSAASNDEINKIVAYNWFGQDTLMPLWETQGSFDIGHQSLGLTIGRIGFRNTRGRLQIWGLAGVSKGDQRAQYLARFTPVSGAAITPEFFRIWDDTYLNHVNVLCTDPTSTWLITTAKRYVGPGEESGTPDQLRYYVKVFHTSVFVNPDEYGYDYRNAATFEFEIADFIRDMQAVACDGTTIYFCQAGSAYSSTRKYLHMYTLDGVYLGVQQIQAGAGRAYDIADPENTGTPDPTKLTYEPEAMFFRMIVGGYDLVMGNTNGIPDGDTGRETSFYTLMPQQSMHIKTTSSSQPGIILDSTYDIVTNSGLLTIGKINDDGSVTNHLELSSGLAKLSNVTATASQFETANPLRDVTYHVSAAGDAGIYDYTNSRWLFKSPVLSTDLAYIGQPLEVLGAVRPFKTNTYSCGTSTRLWTTVYATTGSINTSDARFKSDPLSISQLSESMGFEPDAILDAWGKVNLIVYQWLSAVDAKGADRARWHYGIIAQQVRDAFIAAGIDGTRFGLLCYDEWEDQYEPVMAWRDVTITYTDADGVENSYIKKEEYDTGEKTLVTPAGNRWGIRVDECLWLEAAYQRRRCDRIEERLKYLEGEKMLSKE
ncbi:hypothetical protein GSM90_12600 [Escherichia coli]|nr:hypothetical protein [Escherichia coli]